MFMFGSDFGFSMLMFILTRLLIVEMPVLLLATIIFILPCTQYKCFNSLGDLDGSTSKHTLVGFIINTHTHIGAYSMYINNSFVNFASCVSQKSYYGA